MAPTLRRRQVPGPRTAAPRGNGSNGRAPDDESEEGSTFLIFFSFNDSINIYWFRNANVHLKLFWFGLLTICFEELKLERVYARIALANLASQKVVLKNGFQLEGRMRNDFRTADGNLIDVEIYAILKSDNRLLK